jgi:hypothetical protein
MKAREKRWTAESAAKKLIIRKTIINVITGAGSLRSCEYRLVAAFVGTAIKNAVDNMEKEFSSTVLRDLFQAISFLRFLEHFWNRWLVGAHWNSPFHLRRQNIRQIFSGTASRRRFETR